MVLMLDTYLIPKRLYLHYKDVSMFLNCHVSAIYLEIRHFVLHFLRSP
jgi:hypothetical protein